MNKAITITLCSCMVVLSVMLSILSWRLTCTLQQIGDSSTSSFTSLNTTIAKLNTTLDIVNRPCGNGNPCGTLANIDKMTVKFGDIAVTSQIQVRNSSKLIDSVVTNINQVASNVNTTTAALTTTANSATKAINQTTTDLNTINDTIIKVSPILKHSDDTIADLDSLLKDSNLHQTALNVQSMTSSGADILADGKIEADKFAHPPKKKMTFWTATEAAGDFVRHFMPSIF